LSYGGVWEIIPEVSGQKHPGPAHPGCGGIPS